jgi:hypothetical protein
MVISTSYLYLEQRQSSIISISDILKTYQIFLRQKEQVDLVGKLGVNEFMVLTPGGTPIFHYSTFTLGIH